VAAEALSKGRVKKALLVVPTLRRMFSMEEPLLRGPRNEVCPGRV
jgi:hypothetical protein